ncbi:hypothetical protein [Pseudogracilibacillus auburnensis]|uniref:hypothetical protein n=1 Tax=Pseudogracilibacillus auburnensis TaxID=1494959 RepID=UPI001A958E0E|nr:hypothetical protein [Pseudogracilibacillus auburnensis]MBO1004892.1 hypothetical protein [Pseudogracilibacillus auburnensis]
MKRFLYYFGWTIVIGIIIYFGAKYQLRLQQEASVTFEIVPVVLLSTIFPFAIGMLLRLPKLLNEIKQNKQWTFDWITVPLYFINIYIIILSARKYIAINTTGYIFRKSNHSNDSWCRVWVYLVG